MDRDQLRGLLDEVAIELRAARAVARVYVIGGAAMALAYDAERTTRDVDALVLEGHGPLIAAVRTVARRHGLPSTWLNEQAAAYVPTTKDTASVAIYDDPHLRVIVASPPHLLVMKAHAARTTDVEDIRRLLDLTGVATFAHLEALCDDLFPGQVLSERSRAVLHELFGS